MSIESAPKAITSVAMKPSIRAPIRHPEADSMIENLYNYRVSAERLRGLAQERGTGQT
jgi:hypothetical protein